MKLSLSFIIPFLNGIMNLESNIPIQLVLLKRKLLFKVFCFDQLKID